MQDKIKKIVSESGIFWQYCGERYPDELRHGNACAWIAETADKWCIGTGADIGAGKYPFRDAFPIRKHKINAYNLECFHDGSLDYIFSSHCLEHLEKPVDAVTEWARKIRAGGILFLYLPHPDMRLWRPGAPWVGEAHKWSPDFETVSALLKSCGFSIVGGSGARDPHWSFWIVGRRNG